MVGGALNRWRRHVNAQASVAHSGHSGARTAGLHLHPDSHRVGVGGDEGHSSADDARQVVQ